MKSCGSFSGKARRADHTYLGCMGISGVTRVRPGMVDVDVRKVGKVHARSVLAVLGLAAMSGAAAPAFAQDVYDQDVESVLSSETPAATRRPGLPVVGLMADAGLPDGFMGALTIRPIQYLRLHAGAGTNSTSPGFRVGVSVLPLGMGPSVNLEVGHYLDGEANGLVRKAVGGLGRFATYVNRLNYTFANAHAGLDIGKQDFTFFIHGGFTYLHARLRDVMAPPDTVSSTGRTSITFREDPIVKMFTPSVKVGLIVYLQ
jgi:hypothetical protein